MDTLIFTHDRFGEHEVPDGHAEQRPRYRAVERALMGQGLDALPRREAPLGDWDTIEAAHSQAYAARIRAAAPQADDEIVALDPDTFMGPSSLEAARRGAGAAISAVDAVVSGEASNAFVASRPPGHHSTADRAMGFCLFNNVAIAALHARNAHGLDRIAVVDFDVHHGNGTQAIFKEDARAFFASSHEWPQYPGTGRADERGSHGQIYNAPLASGEGGDSFRRVWGEDLLPALADFGPEIIVMSAGFDAHREDPLGGLNLTEEDYVWITGEILGVARETCEGRVVSVLEGGYNLDALGRSAAAHVKTLALGGGHR